MLSEHVTVDRAVSPAVGCTVALKLIDVCRCEAHCESPTASSCAILTPANPLIRVCRRLGRARLILVFQRAMLS